MLTVDDFFAWDADTSSQFDLVPKSELKFVSKITLEPWVVDKPNWSARVVFRYPAYHAFSRGFTRYSILSATERVEDFDSLEDAVKWAVREVNEVSQRFACAALSDAFGALALALEHAQPALERAAAEAAMAERARCADTAAWFAEQAQNGDEDDYNRGVLNCAQSLELRLRAGSFEQPKAPKPAA